MNWIATNSNGWHGFSSIFYPFHRRRQKKKDARKNGSANTQELVIKSLLIFFVCWQHCQEIHGSIIHEKFVCRFESISHRIFISFHKKWKVIESSRGKKSQRIQFILPYDKWWGASYPLWVCSMLTEITIVPNIIIHLINDKNPIWRKKRCSHYQLIPFLFSNVTHSSIALNTQTTS